VRAEPRCGSAPAWIALAASIVSPAVAQAYVGPGAGFALVSSFATLAVAFLTAFVVLLTLPARVLIRSVRRRRTRGGRFRRVIMLGLDGLEPTLVERMMDEGRLPHLSELRRRGTYRRLATSTPALSPVAWSTFATGCDSSRHAIWDFLARDRRSYLPRLSSSEIHGRQHFWRLGPLRIPRGGARVRSLQRSKTFWKVLAEHGVFASVLRVPITFPAEKIDGVMVSGMCVPDLRGSQGSFTFFTTSAGTAERIGGLVIEVKEHGGVIETAIPGPASPFTGETLRMPLTVRVDRSRATLELRVGGERVVARERTYTPWVPLPFRAAPGVTLHGIVRFYPTVVGEQVGLYMTPIHIDPERPSMPIAHPAVFSTYLARLMGPFGTLGLAEDTWAMNEGVLDETAWLDQAYAFHEERKAMWFHTLDRLRNGLAVCVFDLSDRLQHMFFRHLDDGHPANRGRPESPHRGAIEDMYRAMDDLVGRTTRYLREDTALFVLSDHGFKSFRRGIDLNAWLTTHGFLALRDGAGPGEYLSSVDWSRTQAYAVGLGSIYVNIRGRERLGVVPPEEVAEVKRRIREGLAGLRDADGSLAVRRVIDVQREFPGPYTDDGPELLPGFAEGYRESWDCAQGVVGSAVFEDNVRPWSGDHCMDPEIVPGVLFTNLALDAEAPRLMDLGPTALTLLGVDVPGYMMGRNLA